MGMILLRVGRVRVDLFNDRAALFSPCRRYRYLLRRRWDNRPPCLYIGINPSHADEARDDMLTQRFPRWEDRWGFGEHRAVNLFAAVASRPDVMMAMDEPVGPDNDKWLTAQALETNAMNGIILIGWGNGGGHLDRDVAVLALLREAGADLYCLGRTNSGAPIHPSARGTHRLPDSVEPVRFD